MTDSLLANFNTAGKKINKSTSGLKMLPLACGLWQQFEDFGHSFSLYGLLIKVKENFDETRIMMKGMKIVNYN